MKQNHSRTVKHFAMRWDQRCFSQNNKFLSTETESVPRDESEQKSYAKKLVKQMKKMPHEEQGLTATLEAVEEIHVCKL